MLTFTNREWLTLLVTHLHFFQYTIQTQKMQKSNQANAPQQTNSGRHTSTEKEGRTHNTGLAKGAVQYSADAFVVNQKIVLCRHICGENRHLRQARNRWLNGSNIGYHQALTDSELGNINCRIRVDVGEKRGVEPTLYATGSIT